MQKYNVVRAKKYTSNGEEKTAWLQVGMMTEFDNGGKILEFNDRAEVYQIFPLKPKTQSTQQAHQQPDNDMPPIENIPF